MKLSTEYLVRLLSEGKIEGLTAIEKVAILGLAGDHMACSIEDLNKLDILKHYLYLVITVYSVSDLDEPLVEMYNKVKSNPQDLLTLLQVLYSVDNRPIVSSPIKQFILDDLIGPIWRDPDFLFLEADYLGIIKYLRYFASGLDSNRIYALEKVFVQDLSIFDKFPEDRLPRIIKGLQLCLPLLKKYCPVSEKNYPFNRSRVRELHYSSENLRIKIPDKIENSNSYTLRGLWTVIDGELVIKKKFYCNPNTSGALKQIRTLVKRLEQAYPELKDSLRSNGNEVVWEEKLIFKIPEELRVLEFLLVGEDPDQRRVTT